MPVVNMPDGVPVRFPDEMPPDQIRALIQKKFPEAVAQVAPAAPAAVGGSAPVAPTLNPAVQGAGAGLADIGRFVEMVNPARPALDLMRTGYGVATGREAPDLSFTNMLAGVGTRAANDAGYATPAEKDMPFANRAIYNVARFVPQVAGSVPAFVRAAGVRAAELTAGAIPRFGDKFLSAYMGQNVGRTVAGDAAATVGAGTALAGTQGLSDDTRNIAGGAIGHGADFAATLAGGVSGATALSGIISGVKAAGKAAGRPFGLNIDRTVPIDRSLPPMEAIETRPSTTAVDRAAGDLQNRVSDPGGPTAVLQRMQTNRAELDPHLAALPPPAALSEDPGLAGLQRGVDMQDRGRATTRDQNFRSSVRSTIDRVAPEGATVEPLIARARTEANTRIAGAQEGVDRAQTYVDRTQEVRQQHARDLPPEHAEARVDASRQLDRAIVEEGYIPARREKNRQFDEAPGRHEQLPSDEVSAAAADVRNRLNDLVPNGQQMPGEFVRRLEALAPRMEVDPATGQTVNVGGPGTALGGDLADMRKYLGTAHENARRAGNFELADSIGRLRTAVNRTIETAPGYAEANQNYRQFADTYRPARGEPAADFTRAIDRDPQRGVTPPERTAGRFLDSGQPQQSGALARMTEASPARGEAGHATRDYLLADMSAKGVLDQQTGTIRPDRLRAWMNKRSDFHSLDQNFQMEVRDTLTRAQRGEQLSGRFAEEVAAAQRTLGQTTDEVNRGALGLVINSDPDKAVAAIMRQPDRSGRLLDELIRVTEHDPQARNGLKVAVRDFLIDKATTTATEALRPGDRRGPVSPAQLTKIFNEHERELARIFSPEEMNTLRAGHRGMELMKNLNTQGTAGSNTTEKLFDQLRNSTLGKGVETALRLKYGVLQTGGIAATLRRALPASTAVEQQSRELIRRSAFEPEIMELLLGRKVPVGSPAWNKRMTRLLAVEHGVQEATQPDPDRPD